MSRTLQTYKNSIDANLSPMGAVEKELYGYMTLFLHKLVQHEPNYADDELEGVGPVSSSQITQVERRDMGAFADSTFTNNASQLTTSGRDNNGSNKPTSPTGRRSKVLSFGDVTEDGIDVSPTLAEAITNFDASTLDVGRKAAADGIAILLELARESYAMRKGSYRCKRRLYQIVQSFAVYANVNVSVRNEVADHVGDLLEICFSWHDADATTPTSPLSKRSEPRTSGRSLEEIDALKTTLQGNNVPISIAHELCECYSLEMLLDVGLPPSVCSSRFEGLMAIMLERRGRVVSTITASKAVLTLLLKAINLKQLEYVLKLGMCVEPKGRARFYDRLIADGGLGMLIHAAKDPNQLSVALSILLLVTIPSMGDGGKVVADSASVPTGTAAGAPKQATKEETKSKVVQCTAWSANPQIVYDLLLSIGNTIKRARLADATLEPRMAEVLENIVCFSRHMAAVAVSAIASMMEEVMCPFVPMFFPAMIMFLKRKEATEQSEIIHEWLNIIAARIIASLNTSAPALGAPSTATRRASVTSTTSAPRSSPVAAAALRNRASSPAGKHVGGNLESPKSKLNKSTRTGATLPIPSGSIVMALAPYFGFVRALLEETQWRIGIQTLLVKTKVACESVLSQRRGGRHTLGSGAAGHVLRLITPILDAASKPATAIKRARSNSVRGGANGDASPSAKSPSRTPKAERPFYSLSTSPKNRDGSASPVAVVVPWNTRMAQRLFNRTPWADRSLDDDEDE